MIKPVFLKKGQLAQLEFWPKICMALSDAGGSGGPSASYNSSSRKVYFQNIVGEMKLTIPIKSIKVFVSSYPPDLDCTSNIDIIKIELDAETPFPTPNLRADRGPWLYSQLGPRRPIFEIH